jgi:hypothetical protein
MMNVLLGDSEMTLNQQQLSSAQHAFNVFVFQVERFSSSYGFTINYVVNA